MTRFLWIFLRATVALLCSSLLGCTGAYRIVTHEADNGTTINRTVENEIGVAGDLTPDWKRPPKRAPVELRPQTRCFMDVQRTQKSHGDVEYRLILTWIVPEPLDVERSKSLTLDVDGTEHVLSGEGEIKRHTDPGTETVRESLEYVVTRDLLKDIAEAEKVRVEITGLSGRLGGHFRKENFENFKRFVEDYVDWPAGPARL